MPEHYYGPNGTMAYMNFQCANPDPRTRNERRVAKRLARKGR